MTWKRLKDNFKTMPKIWLIPFFWMYPELTMSIWIFEGPTIKDRGMRHILAFLLVALHVGLVVLIITVMQKCNI